LDAGAAVDLKFRIEASAGYSDLRTGAASGGLHCVEVGGIAVALIEFLKASMLHASDPHDQKKFRSFMG